MSRFIFYVWNGSKDDGYMKRYTKNNSNHQASNYLLVKLYIPKRSFNVDNMLAEIGDQKCESESIDVDESIRTELFFFVPATQHKNSN